MVEQCIQRHIALRWMETRALAAALTLIACCSGASAVATVPEGSFVHSEVSGLEAASPVCQRVWIEARTYWLKAVDEQNLVGTYTNTRMSVPVGAVPESGCIFALPAPQPVSGQLRMWNVTGRRVEGPHWRIEATPAPGSGTLGLPTDPFQTDLDLTDGGSVTDRAPTLGPIGMRFSRQRPMPDDLDGAIQTLVADLYSGECTRVMLTTAPNNQSDKPSLAAAACDVRQRVLDVLGSYQSMRVINVISLDGYSLPGRLRQVRESYFVTFETHHSKGLQSMGFALVGREGENHFEPVILW